MVSMMQWCVSEGDVAAVRSSHVLELIHSPLGVALADLSQGLVLVAALLHVLLVELVHGCLFGLVFRHGQVVLEGLRFKF